MAFAEIFSDMTVLSVVLFVVGFALLIGEMFTPGFGLLGISGIIVLVADIFITAKSVIHGIILTAMVVLVLCILLLIAMILASNGILPKRLVLTSATSAAAGFTSAPKDGSLVGGKGVTLTVMRPSGTVELEGRRLTALTRGEFLEKGVDVEIIEAEGSRIVVKAASK